MPSPQQRLNVHFAGSKHIPCWPSLGLLSCKCWLSQRCAYYPLQHFRDFHVSIVTIVWTLWVFTNFNHAAQVASCAKVLTANGALWRNEFSHGAANRPRLGSPTTMRPRRARVKTTCGTQQSWAVGTYLPCSQCSICVLSIRHWPYACHSRSPQPQENWHWTSQNPPISKAFTLRAEPLQCCSLWRRKSTGHIRHPVRHRW